MYRALGFQLNFSYGSGGTSVNAWLQTSLDGGTTWCDTVALGQLTTASARVVGSLISSASYALTAATDGALTAGTLNNGLFGPLWRVKYTSIGTYADYTIVQRYTRERISYWLCRPAALELRRSQDGRNAVCLRRAEG
jgi:hypothetical protein